MAVIGALVIAWSSILVRLADVSPSTAAIFRCAYALPLLAALAWREDRRLGPRPARGRRLAAGAGVFFAADLICWHHAIADVGAGLATVLGNLQVVLVAFAAWAVLGERPERRIVVAVPVVFTGAVMISGVLEDGGYGRDPVLGTVYGVLTTLAYSAFLLVQPVGAVALAMLILGERPSALQLAGVAVVLAGIAVASVPARLRRTRALAT